MADEKHGMIHPSEQRESAACQSGMLFVNICYAHDMLEYIHESVSGKIR